jgi:hypothetical protein
MRNDSTTDRPVKLVCINQLSEYPFPAIDPSALGWL